MKVLFLANKIPWPLKDGGAIGVFSLSYGLAKAGAWMDMLAINTRKHHIDLENIPTQIRNTLNLETVSIDTNIQPLKLFSNFLFSKKPYISERFYHNDFKKALINKLKNNTYDVIILEMLYLSSYIPTIREHSNAHISMRAPNIEHEIWQQIAGNTKNPLKRFYLKNMAKRIHRLEKNCMNTYDSLMPVSEVNAETYKQMGVTVPISLTTTGVFLDKLPSAENINTENAIAHIGALDWMPNLEGLDWFVKNVWHIIHKELPDVKFYIAGRNAPENAKQRFKGENIVFLGEVPDAYEFMLSKSIFIAPLLSGSGMRVKIIEALALKRSMVSTSIGAEGINIEHEKHLLIADTPQTFAQACIRLIKDKNLQKQLADEGNIFVNQHYDNIKIAENLLNFYNENLK